MPLSESEQIAGFTGRSLSGTGTTFSPAVGCATSVDWIAIAVSTTAISGAAASVALSVQWSLDGGTTWCDADGADSFTAITATGNAVKRFQTKGQLFRLKEVVTGTTPAATYAVSTCIG